MYDLITRRVLTVLLILLVLAALVGVGMVDYGWLHAYKII